MAKRKLRVLGLGAHPDDMEWHCGGTLARYAGEGHTVFICHVSNGDKGSFRYSSEELAKVRRREAIAAARVIGATSLTAGVPDGEVVNSVEVQRRVTEAIRQARPDVIIATDPNDYHGDHRAVGEMAMHCAHMATCPLYKTETAHVRVSPTIYFCETSGGLNFEPTEWVDISEVFRTKVRMMLAHKSQLEWMGARGEARQKIAAQFEVIARYRGMQCGVAHAEAFRLCMALPRPRPYRVLP